MEDWLKKDWVIRYTPPVAALVFTLLFLSLGSWQLDRAAEKQAFLDSFAADAPYAQPNDFAELETFDRFETYGRYDAERQILIENIPNEGRLGFYVITPFEPSTNDPLLLVNRGWVPSGGPGAPLPDISVEPGFGTVRGLAGNLPRVAIRPGEAFVQQSGWPRLAVYPTSEEVASELGEPVLPVVMLLSPDADAGFVRQWQPNVSGPMTHYSYAFQWFAMAAAVVGIAGWFYRRAWRGG